MRHFRDPTGGRTRFLMSSPTDAAVSPATTIYFVRHGETSENARKIVQGQLIDCPLSERGFEQAAAVAAWFDDVPLDRLYASPLLRARQTADAVLARKPGIPLVPLPGLMEMSFGILEGRSYEGENAAFFQWLASRWAAGRFNDRLDGGESVQDVITRAHASLDHIVSESRGQTVAVVTHGRWLRVLLSTILEGYRLESMDELLHTNTAVSRILHRDDRFAADFIATTDHLASIPDSRRLSGTGT